MAKNTNKGYRIGAIKRRLKVEKRACQYSAQRISKAYRTTLKSLTFEERQLIAQALVRSIGIKNTAISVSLQFSENGLRQNSTLESSDGRLR